MAGVTLRDISKTYPGGPTVIERLSFTVEPEEFMVLVGPSGCGKSTTLRIIAGLEDATGGTVMVGDRVVNDDPPKDRDIAMVFQNFALYPHMTAYDNLAFSLKLRRRELGLSKADIDAKVRETARVLAIEHLLKRKPRQLSGGERQRVAVGRAIVRRPKAFLFDEPLSNVDAKSRVEMRAEIKRLQRQFKTTTVYVTHDQEEAMSLGDRVLVMKSGKLQQCGRPQDVYERPANRFVAGFVGTPPMSFLEGRVETDDGRLTFTTGPTRIPLPSSWAQSLAGRAGQPAVLGIRPEGLQLAAGADAPLQGRVNLVENLGAFKDVHMTLIGGQSLVGRFVVAAPLAEGQEVRLSPEMTRAHLFEAGENGVNLTANVAVSA